jgi:hypothetical protein
LVIDVALLMPQERHIISTIFSIGEVASHSSSALFSTTHQHPPMITTLNIQTVHGIAHPIAEAASVDEASFEGSSAEEPAEPPTVKRDREEAAARLQVAAKQASLRTTNQ